MGCGGAPGGAARRPSERSGLDPGTCFALVPGACVTHERAACHWNGAGVHEQRGSMQ